MQFELKGAHFHISDNNREVIEEKVARLRKFESGIERLVVTITLEGSGIHQLKADIHFHWKHACHISCNDRELYSGIDRLFQEIETKCRREKERVKNHHRGAPPL